MMKNGLSSPRTPRSPRSPSKAVSADTAIRQRCVVAAFVIIAAFCPFIALSCIKVMGSQQLVTQDVPAMVALERFKSPENNALLKQVKTLQNVVEALNSSQINMALEISSLHEKMSETDKVIERLNMNPNEKRISSSRRTALAAIVKQHNLTTPDAIDLLDRIASQTIKYHSDRDFLVFEHMMKTGGTSLSDVLNKSIGGILPGSQRSDYFAYRQFEQEYNQTSNKQEWWKSQKVMYSHTMLRSMYEDKTEHLAKWLQGKFPNPFKQIKVLTLIRDPVNYMASNMNEWMCQQDNRRRATVQRLLYWKKNCTGNKPCPHLNGTLLGDPSVWAAYNQSDACKGLNRSFLADDWLVHEGRPKCASDEPKNKRWTRICKEENPLDYCRSPQKMMNSHAFTPLHDSYRLWVLPPSDNATTAQYESSALTNLGGLSEHKYPIWWLGITERMHESMCLLHYSLQIPFVDTPHTRFYRCRPTSDWTEADRAMAREKEQLNFAAFRAANAILDVRVANMCHDIKTRSKMNQPVTSLPDSCCANAPVLGDDPLALGEDEIRTS